MKQIIRLTESDLHRIVKESVQIILEGELSSFLTKFQAQLERLDNQHSELDATDKKLTRQINYLKKLMKDYPEEAHLQERELNELTSQRDDIRRQKAEIRSQRQALIKDRNERLSPSAMRKKAKAVKDALEPMPELRGRDVVPKELWDKRNKSRKQVKYIERHNWVEERYNEILTNGFLLVPKAKEITTTSNGKRIVKDLSGPMNKKFNIKLFTQYVEKNHPEKIVKTTLIPRKRERNQLDDVSYYDMKVFLEDNPQQSQQQPQQQPAVERPNTIRFDNPNIIRFSKDDVPDYSY